MSLHPRPNAEQSYAGSEGSEAPLLDVPLLCNPPFGGVLLTSFVNGQVHTGLGPVSISGRVDDSWGMNFRL